MAQSRIPVLIIEQDGHARELLCNTIAAIPVLSLLAETDSLFYGYELVRHNRPRLVFLNLNEQLDKGLDMARRISRYFPDTVMVASGNYTGPDILRACMEAGIRDYLIRPLDAEDIHRVFAKHQAMLGPHDERDQTGRILSVFSNKGGLGKTTIAVNLALSLSEVIRKPVALVDLNLQLGDITTFLDIEPKQTIVDIARNIGRVDAAYLETSLAQYHCNANGAQVYILADPLHLEEAEEVTAEQVNAVLTVLKASFEYVIVDTTSTLDTKTLTALDLSDDVLLVSMVNLPSIRSTQRLLGLFNRLEYNLDKVKLVLNRYMANDEITVEDVEETLEHAVFWKIPNNYPVVMTAINRGIPIALLDGGKALDKTFRELARQLSGILPEESASALNTAGAPAGGANGSHGRPPNGSPFTKPEASADVSSQTGKSIILRLLRNVLSKNTQKA